MEGAGEKWKILNFGRTERKDGSMRPMSGRCRHRGNSECWRYVRRKRGWYLREERSTRSIREGLAVPDQGEPRRPPTRPNLHIIPSRLTYTYPSTRPSSCLARSPSFHRAFPIAPLAPRFRLSVLTAAALWTSAITAQKLMFRMLRILPSLLSRERIASSTWILIEFWSNFGRTKVYEFFVE